jgi:ribonucrease Y
MKSKGGVHVNSVLIYEIIAGIIIAIIILVEFYIIKNKSSAIKEKAIEESNRLKDEAKKRS